MDAVKELKRVIDQFESDEITEENLSKQFDKLANSIETDKVTYQEIFELVLSGSTIEAMLVIDSTVGDLT